LSTKTGILLTNLLHESGVPNDVFITIIGDGTIGEYLVNNKNVDGISFTGSSDVGKKICASNQNQIKKLSLEMSGSDYGIVFDDANIELAVSGLIWGAFSNAGQVCVATEKILVQETIYEKFKKLFVEEVKKLRIGIDISPIITLDKLKNVLNIIKKIKTNGCKLLTGGIKFKNNAGNYLYPTVIECNNKNYMSSIKELFAPIVYIGSFSSEDDLLNITNSSRYGLGCSIWTNNIKRHQDILMNIESGMIWINEVNLPLPQVPWLGIKDSSVGFALSKDAVYDATNYKVFHIDSSNVSREWWYPYSKN